MLHRTPLVIVLAAMLVTGCTRFDVTLDAEATAIAADYRHACVIRTDRTVACWGDNRTAQLGDGTTDNSFDELRPVAGIDDVRELAVGEDFSCAVARDAEVRCWGLDYQGQLGDGRTLTIGGPTTPVPGVTGSVELAAGRSHACALAADGQVRCWGANDSGQLGDGSRTTRLAPVRASTVDDVVALSAGAGFTCALSSAGTVSCWGLNSVGQLGTGDRVDRTEPAIVTGLDRVTSIDSQVATTCAVRDDGSVWCWGAQVDALEDRPPTATQVAGISGATAIAVGEGSSCALNGTGIVCWGGRSPVHIETTEVDDLVDLGIVGSSLCTVARSGVVACRPLD
jgi:alpha-tubulin suppressor-like RCC1 family protein